MVAAVVASIFHDGEDAEADAPFDFWALSLSWLPTFCAGAENHGDAQCDAERGFGVHGLWPQLDDGSPPEFCDTAFSPPNQADLGRVSDLFPDAWLARHEWNRHGSCTGLSVADYFQVIRRAVEAVTIPDRFIAPADAQRLSPGTVEDAFKTANPGLDDGAMSVDCAGGRLDEVRLCLSHALEFRDCPEVHRRSCRAATIAVPAVR